MKTADFKVFMELLETDRVNLECNGYLYLRLSERQTVQLVDWYIQHNLATLEIDTAGVKWFNLGAYCIKVDKYIELNEKYGYVDMSKKYGLC